MHPLASDGAIAEAHARTCTLTQSVTTGFANLETRISEVGRTTVRVGDDLETMDRLRTRASEARDIITYYYEFAKGDLNRWVRPLSRSSGLLR